MRVLYISLHTHTPRTHTHTHTHTHTSHTHTHIHVHTQLSMGLLSNHILGVHAYVTHYDTLHNPVQPRMCASITCIHTSVLHAYKLY